ncbi:MAG: DEAD/DEAH box helicase [Clostridia bacterium]
MTYLAHSSKDGIEAQTYADHVRGVRSLASQYALETGHYSKYDRVVLQQVTEEAAEYHDIGKLNLENQKVLSGEVTAKVLPVNHVDAGAAYWLKDQRSSVIPAILTQAHHVGFPDFSAEMNREELAFRDAQIADLVDQELKELEAIHNSLIGQRSRTAMGEGVTGDCSVFLRMALSCIADADHTDTARHYRKYPQMDEHIPLKAGERLARLDECVTDLQRNNAATERNALRSEMYQSCRNADIKSNISSCDSPVGSGKTTAVMAHLLAQAQKRGLRRIFVVLPFTNIIRQSVKTYRTMLTLPGENPEEVVAELHHRADFENEDVRYLTSLWRAPIIVTTAVAFFETLASNSTGTLRRLHELPGSAIFVDESHAALPVNLLPVAWKWMRILSDEWSCYWILASGSISRFWTIREIAGNNAPPDISEIVDPTVRSKLSSYEHHRITYRYNLSPQFTEGLAEWIASFSGPRLVILNTVQSAAVLADHFAQKYGREKVEHLSTSLTPIDRESTLDWVKFRLADPKDTDWTLVATSCMEAGVDFSFRIGFRELCSLSSLLQAGGRINREGSNNKAEIWTFCIAEDGMLKRNPALKQAGIVLKDYLEKNIPISPQLTTESIRKEIALYGLNPMHQKLMEFEDLQNFPQVECNFKVINSDTRLAVVDTDIVKRLQAGKVNWRELQKVSIQIAKYKLDELKIPNIVDEIYHWNLEYDHFLGYMAGIVKLKKLSGQVLII